MPLGLKNEGDCVACSVEGDNVMEKKLPYQPNTGHAGSPRSLGLQPQASVSATSLDEREPGESFLCRAPRSWLPLSLLLWIEQMLFGFGLQHWIRFRNNKLLHLLTSLLTCEAPNSTKKPQWPGPSLSFQICSSQWHPSRSLHAPKPASEHLSRVCLTLCFQAHCPL